MLRILGPFQDDGSLTLPRGAQGLLLGDLLLHAGEPLSTDRLADRLYPNVAPGEAAPRLHVVISRLRRRLRDAAAPCRIRTLDGAYALEVDEDELDSHCFEALVARASAAPDVAVALALLSSACALWRGPVLVDLGLEGEPAARRLEEGRLAALELRHRLAVELGADDAVGELLQAQEQHPFHEGLAAAAMTALYRAGRQVDALRHFSRLRDRLRDELGLEPGRRLQHLERAILLQELPVAAPAARAVLPPADRSGPTLLGRDGELAALGDRLAASALVAIVGPAGVGKTALATVALLGHAAAGGSVARADLAPVTDEAELATVVARALSVDLSGAADAGTELAEAVGSRSVLLLLDNCEHVLDPVAGMVTSLLRGCPGLRVWVTSRRPLHLPGEEVLPLHPLPSPAAVALLRRRLDLLGASLPVDEETEAAAAALCDRLDRLPLAVELAAPPLALLGLDELLARLPHRLRLLRATDAHADDEIRHGSLAQAIAGSVELVGPDERRLFCSLSAFAGSFDLAGAHALAAAGPAPLDAGSPPRATHDELDTFDGLRTLVDHSLLSTDRGAIGRFRLLESLRAFGEAQLSPDERGRLRDRHAEVMAARMDGAWDKLRGCDELDQARRIDADIDDLRRAVGHSVARGRADLALAIAAPLVLHQFDHLWLEPADWAAAALAQPGADEHPLAAAGHVAVGYGLQHRGRYDEAAEHGRRADELDEAAGRAPSWIAATLLGAATAYLGRREEALHWAEAAVARARRAGDDYGVSRGLWTHVYAAASTGRYDIAVAEEAYRLAERTGSTTARTRANLLMGIVHAVEDPTTARAYCRTAERLAMRADLRYYVGIARAFAAHALGRSDPAAGMAEFVGLLGWYVTSAVSLGASRSLIRESIPIFVALGLDELAAALHGSEPPFCYRPALNAEAVARAERRLGAERFATASMRWRGLGESDLLGQLARAIPVELLPEESPLHRLRSPR